MLETEKLRETGHGGWVSQNATACYLLCHGTLQRPHTCYAVFFAGVSSTTLISQQRVAMKQANNQP